MNVEDNFERAIDGVLNNPAKMIVFMTLAESHGQYFTEANLADAVRKIQGDNPGWPVERSNRSVFFDYCRNSIGPIGMLVKDMVPNYRGTGEVEAFRVSDYGLSIGPAICGVGMSWELAYPEKSIQKLLGYSNSKAGLDRMPSLRMAIYKQILSEPGGRTRQEIVSAIGTNNERFKHLIPKLKDENIVTENVYGLDSPIELIKPPGRAAAKSNITAETKAVYDLVTELVDCGRSAITGAEFKEAFNARYPNYDPKMALKRLRLSGKAGNIALSKVSGGGAKASPLTMSHDYFEPTKNLVGDIDRLAIDESFAMEAARRAHNILRNPVEVSLLMAKARANSAIINQPTHNETIRLVIDSIPESGIKTRDAYKMLKSGLGNMSYNNFRRILAYRRGEGYKLVPSKENSSATVIVPDRPQSSRHS